MMKLLLILLFPLLHFSCKKKETSFPVSTIGKEVIGTWGWFESYTYSEKNDGTVCKNEIISTGGGTISI
ncbi:MAG: hypothetical protein V4615_06635, partial [Bacteroidota bacterium]